MTQLGCVVLVTLILLVPCSPLEAAPIEVRLVEGTAHGLMVVRSVGGEAVAHGDFLQTVHRDRVETRLVLRFKDGSLHDETHAFSQQRVFTLLSYRVVQRGPSFPETLEAVLDRKAGTYKVLSTRDGKEEASSGSIELPLDVYNGMVPMLLKNLAPAGSETVHIVAFTPKPRLIQLEMVPAGSLRLVAGDSTRQGMRYALKPKLGAVVRAFATLMGKAPADQECVILTEDVPGFVRCDGSLYLKGPVWRMEMTTAR
jgi:hypothetical protein